MTQWIEQFAPLKESLNLNVRDEQEALANAIIAVIDSPIGTKHLAAEAQTGCGKSFAYLIPLIHKVKSGDFRGVVSTETLTLQDQVAYKDLPLLQKVYGGFTFMSLKGRGNYLCLSKANVEASSHPEVLPYLSKIEAAAGRFTEGTQDELSRALNEKIPDEIWKYISGESDFCSDCDADDRMCYSSIARQIAPTRDIVVTNHAMLQADASLGDGAILGTHQFVVVDEAHTLEDVFISSLQVDISGWDIFKAKKSIHTGAQTAGTILNEGTLSAIADHVEKDMDFILTSVINFYGVFHKDGWDKAEGVLREKTLYGGASSQDIEYMRVMEEDVPARIEAMTGYFKTLNDKLIKAKETMAGSGKSGKRNITKAITAVSMLKRVIGLLADTITSKTGIVEQFGVPYVVEYHGFFDKESRKRVSLSFVPIDVSKFMSENLWGYDPTSGNAAKTCIMVSATLADITDGTFRFARTSVGFPSSGVQEMTVASPFNYDEQQLIYTTPGNWETVPVERAQYSLDEAVELINAAGGRSLLLFTAKSELEYAAEELRNMGLPYNIYVQGEGMSKKELADAFMSDVNSVLIATKSFFTGVNFSGEACSMVIICKFPLKRFTGVCQAQISHWRSRGFSEWYEMQALTVFRQAVGRLIRSETDRGVVAIIDKRVSNPKERVYNTASMGISTLGSIVTNSMEDLHEFFRQ